MCKVPALCIDHIEHEEDFHARACPLRGDMYEENERSMGAAHRLAEDTPRRGNNRNRAGFRGTGNYELSDEAAAGANPLSLGVNESNVVEVRALPPQ